MKNKKTTTAKKPAAKRPVKKQPPKLDDSIEEILSLILEGYTFRKIADIYNVPLSTLHYTLNKVEHSARVRNALDISASSYADKAEEVLIDAVGTKEELQRARELAQHYRWKAGKRSPKKYGESSTLKLDAEVSDKRIDTSKLSTDELLTYKTIYDKASPSD